MSHDTMFGFLSHDGLPLAIIHFRLGFSHRNQASSELGGIFWPWTSQTSQKTDIPLAKLAIKTGLGGCLGPEVKEAPENLSGIEPRGLSWCKSSGSVVLCC